MEERSDQELTSASCLGDRAAYALLVRRHYKSVFLVCFGILGNVHDAEDIAQDAMLRGFEQIGRLRDGSRCPPEGFLQDAPDPLPSKGRPRSTPTHCC
ncbi:MAG: hypothetical protein NTZ17_06615 [Phycisphaerae bacterium]|nr:hypothetical protein [Phycisphaerae bacterium]